MSSEIRTTNGKHLEPGSALQNSNKANDTNNTEGGERELLREFIHV
jgi:hypothetical protein